MHKLVKGLDVILTTAPSQYAQLTFHGLEYLYAAISGMKNTRVHFIHPDITNKKTVKELTDEISKTEFSDNILLCVSVPFETLDQSRELVQRIKQKMKDKKIEVVIGGLWPTAGGESALKHFPEADYVVRGYGEKALREIVLYRKTKPIENTVTRTEQDILKGRRSYVGFSDVFLPKRLNHFIQIEDLLVAPMNFRRECAGRCSFCIKDVFTLDNSKQNDLNLKPGNVIAREIMDLHQKGVTVISGIDHDALGIDPSNWFSIIEDIEKAGLMGKMKLYLETRLENLSAHPELVPQLSEFGLVHLFMGLETPITSQLERYNKLITMNGRSTGDEYRQKIERAISLLNKNNIFFTFGAMAIDAEMQFSEYEEYIKLIRNDNLYRHMSDFTKPIYVYPGTAMYNQYRAKGFFKESNDNLNKTDTPYYFKDSRVERMLDMFNFFKDQIPTEERISFQHSAWYKAIFDDKERVKHIQSIEHRIKEIKIRMIESVISMIHQNEKSERMMKMVGEFSQETVETIRDSGILFNAKNYPKHV